MIPDTNFPGIELAVRAAKRNQNIIKNLRKEWIMESCMWWVLGSELRSDTEERSKTLCWNILKATKPFPGNLDDINWVSFSSAYLRISSVAWKTLSWRYIYKKSVSFSIKSVSFSGCSTCLRERSRATTPPKKDF